MCWIHSILLGIHYANMWKAIVEACCVEMLRFNTLEMICYVLTCRLAWSVANDIYDSIYYSN